MNLLLAMILHTFATLNFPSPPMHRGVNPSTPAAGPSFSPESIGDPFMTLWRAENVALGNGDPIDSWPDAGLLELPLIAAGAKRPTYQTADANFGGRPSVRFDGVNDIMTVDAAVPAGIRNGAVMIVARFRAAPNNKYLWAATDLGYGLGAGVTVYSDTNAAATVNAGASVSGGVLAQTPFVLFATLPEGGESSFLTLNGAPAGNGFIGARFVERFWLFGGNDFNNWSPIDVAEIVVFRQPISQIQRIGLVNWEMSRYAIARADQKDFNGVTKSGDAPAGHLATADSLQTGFADSTLFPKADNTTGALP